MVSFATTRDECETIIKIARRAVGLAKQNRLKYDFQDAEMDVTAVHANGTPLDLEKLLNADDNNFGHDVFGIWRHIDRTTGKLENHFLPRCARSE